MSRCFAGLSRLPRPPDGFLWSRRPPRRIRGFAFPVSRQVEMTLARSTPPSTADVSMAKT